MRLKLQLAYEGIVQRTGLFRSMRLSSTSTGIESVRANGLVNQPPTSDRAKSLTSSAPLVYLDMPPTIFRISTTCTGFECRFACTYSQYPSTRPGLATLDGLLTSTSCLDVSSKRRSLLGMVR